MYWRLSLSFLFVLLLLAVAYIIIATFASNKYYNETTQRLNADVADYLIKESPPFKDGKVDKESLGVIMHSMMAVNPGIEVYLISPDGEILSFVVLDKKVKLSRVDIAPIKDFISQKGEKYVLGDDPRHPGGETIFSATEVYQDGQFLGYVYIVLASEKYENVSALMANSYWLRLGLNSFLLTLVAAFSIGLVLLWLLTRNLRVIIQTVKQFEEGNLKARIPVKGKRGGELTNLSHTFNSMADTIVNNIDELKQVDQLRRELIANVSHDLRNPLAIIQGYIETLLMKSESLSKEDSEKYMKIIHQSSEKLTRLVAELFELSKLEARQVKLKKEPFFIQELIGDACLKHKLTSANKNIEIQSAIEDGLPMVYGDIAMIDRVIQNLLDNAIKYTPQNGKVILRVNKNNEAVEVKVDNTGEGIPEKDLPNVFNRYYKVDKEKEGIEGTGLGLAIVKNILEVHDSNISVKSVPNELTSFYFNLQAYSA